MIFLHGGMKAVKGKTGYSLQAPTRLKQGSKVSGQSSEFRV